MQRTGTHNIPKKSIVFQLKEKFRLADKHLDIPLSVEIFFYGGIAMAWTVDYLEDCGVVAAKLSGEMNWNVHREFAEAMYSLAKKKGVYKIFIDFTDMKPNFTVLQTDDLPDQLLEIGFGPEYKIAAIHDMSSPKKSEFDFFRNVASIKHLRVQQFASRDEAMTWLTGKKSGKLKNNRHEPQ